MIPVEERLPIGEVMDLILVGAALPFKVLEAQGLLLLNEGQVLVSERQFELLVSRGAWVDRRLVLALRASRAGNVEASPDPGQPKRVFSVFDRWERSLWELDGLLRRSAQGRPTATEWQPLVHEFQALVDHDQDVALFISVRQEGQRLALYPQTHALCVAVLSLLTARLAGWDAARLNSLVAAALSMNLSMLELQAKLAQQTDPIRPGQRDAIRAHPQHSVKLLQAAGVSDALWLRAVAEHHEQAGGGGYPQGLSTPCEEARLLRMADVYMAKITPRSTRSGLTPLLASRQLFQQEAGSALALTFIKAVGVHPPGSLVQLKSGEVGVVKARPPHSTAPLVCTLSDKRGQPTPHSVLLDAQDPEHAITGPAPEPALYPRVLGERVFGVVPGDAAAAAQMAKDAAIQATGQAVTQPGSTDRPR